jgi:hypothetical protein
MKTLESNAMYTVRITGEANAIFYLCTKFTSHNFHLTKGIAQRNFHLAESIAPRNFLLA